MRQGHALLRKFRKNPLCWLYCFWPIWPLRSSKCKSGQWEWKEGHLLMAATIPVSGGPRRKLSCWAEARASQNRDSGPEMELGSVLMSSKLGNWFTSGFLLQDLQRTFIVCYKFSVNVSGLNECTNRKCSKMCSLPSLAALGSHRTSQISFSVAALAWWNPVLWTGHHNTPWSSTQRRRRSFAPCEEKQLQTLPLTCLCLCWCPVVCKEVKVQSSPKPRGNAGGF